MIFTLPHFLNLSFFSDTPVTDEIMDVITYKTQHKPNAKIAKGVTLPNKENTTIT